ncbi:MAG TPA: VCBS repeat-containing protein [Sedimentisphaerales bacterium]|nr:VCBS repeat-containing protein [Sedimentisphaerales bacterium]
MRRTAVKLAALALIMLPSSASALLNLGPEELVYTGEDPIQAYGYSVPSYVDWDNDGRKDLIVGEGGAGFAGKVRVYLNSGTASNPQFSDFFYARANEYELSYWYGCNCACMGLFPRVVDWDSDGRKDLIAGTLEGSVRLYLNIGTDGEPTFDGGTPLQFGEVGSKANINVAGRATPTVVDWNNDGKKDLAVGALDGKIYLFINEGTDTMPDFLAATSVKQEGGAELVVPPLDPVFGRSSPVILDLDGDGKKDLLTGNTDGQLLFYSNVGADAAPVFSDYILIESCGLPIDLAGSPRSRPFICDWTGDGRLDVLIGADDGMVHLYEGVPEPATISLFCLAGLILLRKRGT